MANPLKKCYLPGYFTPPTEKDLQQAYWLARKQSEVSELIIVIGQEEDSPINIDTKKNIWDIYIRDTGGDIVKTVTSPNDAPRHYIYKIQEQRPDEPFIIAVPQKVANSQEFQSKFRKFPEYDIIIIPEYDITIRDKMLNSVRENDMKSFMKYVPPEVSNFSITKVFDMLKEDIEEPVEDVIKEKDLQELYKKFGLI